MADEDFDDLDDNDDGGEEVNPLTAARQRVRQQNREIAELRKRDAEGEATRKELAFLRAGIDLDDPRNQYFVKGYEGEFSREAIEAEYQVFSGTRDQAPGEHARVARAAAGAEELSAAQGPKFVQDPNGYQDALARAGSQDAVLAVMREWGSPIADIDD